MGRLPGGSLKESRVFGIRILSLCVIDIGAVHEARIGLLRFLFDTSIIDADILRVRCGYLLGLLELLLFRENRLILFLAWLSLLTGDSGVSRNSICS
jgi:hypothetical protein